MTDAIQAALEAVSGVIWGPWLLIPLLLGTGLYLTIRLGGLQFVRLGAALRLGIFRRKDSGAEGDISQFQALTTALAATVGTGNVVGVATALAIGGPGALFWMWVTGLLGMASKYSEAFLGVRFRTTDAAGERNGGPQQYLERGIRNWFGKTLAVAFTLFTIFACFGIGNLTQGNSVSANLERSFSVPTWVTGIVLTVVALIVLVGGIKSIGRVTAGLVPIMIVIYVVAALYILLVNVGDIPAALGMIFHDAFTGSAAAGGFSGIGHHHRDPVRRRARHLLERVRHGVRGDRGGRRPHQPPRPTGSRVDDADLHRHDHRRDDDRPGDRHDGRILVHRLRWRAVGRLVDDR